jgi:phage terminase large subunit
MKNVRKSETSYAETLANEQIRAIGKAILLYRALPAMAEFHRSPAKNRWLCGGNRSGKSEGNIGYDLCSFALGVHPYRKTPSCATIWTAANTWPLVGKLLWSEKIKTYLPISQIHSVNWHNKGAEIPAELRLVNGNRIEFKAYEQSRKSFEGRAIDAFYGDEQCKSDSEGIWQEIQARLIDKNGFSAQSMTPIIPQTWLEERIEALPETDEVFYADLDDNRKSRGGYIDDREIDELIAQWPADIQETRIKGYFAAFAGAVYKTFNRAIHVITPFKIPADWLRYRAIDWGFNNPFVCLWLARDPDRRWYVYAEHYQARETLAYHAERIKQISGQEKYRVTWADHDAQERHEFRKLGIDTLAAKKKVHLGIEAVQAALKVQADNKPRLFIFKNCRHTIKEISSYKWAEGTETKDARDEPLQVNDHTCDCIRYAIYGVEGKFYFSESDLS